jgi:hypothetical protein
MYWNFGFVHRKSAHSSYCCQNGGPLNRKPLFSQLCPLADLPNHASNSGPMTRAFREALAEPKPCFVRQGDPITATVAGAVNAASGATLPTAQSLDPDDDIQQLANSLESQEGTGLFGGSLSILRSLSSRVFGYPIVTSSNSVQSTLPNPVAPDASQESSSTMNSALSQNLASMHSSTLSQAGSVSDAVTASSPTWRLEPQGSGAVSVTGASATADAGGGHPSFTNAHTSGSGGTSLPAAWEAVGHGKPPEWYLKKLSEAAHVSTETVEAGPNAPSAAVDEISEVATDAAPEALKVRGKVRIKNAWKAVGDLFPEEAMHDAIPVAYVSNQITHTQAWVHCNRKQKTVRIWSRCSVWCYFF